MSVNPNIWGKEMWKLMNCIAFAYSENPTDEDKKNVCIFFNSLSKILPCGECKQHFLKIIEEFPIEKNVENKEMLLKWVNFTHNKVNIKLGKPEFSYEQLLDLLVYEILGEIKVVPQEIKPPPVAQPIRGARPKNLQGGNGSKIITGAKKQKTIKLGAFSSPKKTIQLNRGMRNVIPAACGCKK